MMVHAQDGVDCRSDGQESKLRPIAARNNGHQRRRSRLTGSSRWRENRPPPHFRRAGTRVPSSVKVLRRAAVPHGAVVVILGRVEARSPNSILEEETTTTDTAIALADMARSRTEPALYAVGRPADSHPSCTHSPACHVALRLAHSCPSGSRTYTMRWVAIELGAPFGGGRGVGQGIPRRAPGRICHDGRGHSDGSVDPQSASEGA